MNNKNSWVTRLRLASANAGNHQAICKSLNFNCGHRSLNSSAIADEFLSALYQMSIPKKMTGTDMKGIIELPLTNNSVIPITDNRQPVMTNTIPVILFRFII